VNAAHLSGHFSRFRSEDARARGRAEADEDAQGWTRMVSTRSWLNSHRVRSSWVSCTGSQSRVSRNASLSFPSHPTSLASSHMPHIVILDYVLRPFPPIDDGGVDGSESPPDGHRPPRMANMFLDCPCLKTTCLLTPRGVMSVTGCGVSVGTVCAAGAISATLLRSPLHGNF